MLLPFLRGSDKLKEYYCIRIKIMIVCSEMYMIAFGQKSLSTRENTFFRYGSFQSLLCSCPSIKIQLTDRNKEGEDLTWSQTFKHRRLNQKQTLSREMFTLRYIHSDCRHPYSFITILQLIRKPLKNSMNSNKEHIYCVIQLLLSWGK